ncbi:hypothetical protein WN943_005733 [Citrus x changshan-huyou]
MIRELMRRDWRIQIDHIYREANSAADFLSTHALSLAVGIEYRCMDGSLTGQRERTEKHVEEAVVADIHDEREGR